MKQIPLTNGGFAIVDDEDYEKVSAFTWNKDRHGYARRSLNYYNQATKKKSCKTLLMHAFLFPVERPLITDHINRNRLDNRKENLRAVTHSENVLNSSRCLSTEKFICVITNLKTIRYQVQITVNKRTKYIARCKTMEEAKEIRDNYLKQMEGSNDRRN